MIEDKLLELTRQAASRLSPEGTMAPGRNGSYGDPETPARNTSHWLASFAIAHALTGEAPFRDAAERALAYLIAAVALFEGGVPMRFAGGKDRTNGVLGQGQIVEALYYAFVGLGREDARDAAVALLRRHRFNDEFHCWNRALPAGGWISPDSTFNHQLYFAATAALFRHDDKNVAADLDRFVTGFRHTFVTRLDGRIVHSIMPPPTGLARLRQRLRGRDDTAGLAKKEADYHLYNFHAFALLAAAGVSPGVETSRRWTKAVEFANGPQVAKRLEPRFWSMGLASGTETSACDLGFARTVFDMRAAPDLALAERQLTFVGGPDGSCGLVSPDPLTQQARIYRYWRLLPVHRELMARHAARPVAGL